MVQVPTRGLNLALAEPGGSFSLWRLDDAGYPANPTILAMNQDGSTRSDSPQDLLRRYVEEISGELHLEPLLSRIVESACRLIGADGGTIGLFDPQRNVTRESAMYGMPERELGTEIWAGVDLASLVLESDGGGTMNYGDINHSSPPGLANRRVIGVPIHWRGELTGFLGVSAASFGDLVSDPWETLKVFARHAGIAIENARRYALEQRRTTRFELVARVAQIINAGNDVNLMLQQAADAIHEVLEFPNVDIPLIDARDPSILVVEIRGGSYKQLINRVDRLPISTGVMGAAVRERRTQRVDQVQADNRYITPPATEGARAELAVPIVFGGEVLGVVNVEGEQPYDDLDQRTIEIVADHLGIAIHNARLHAKNREAAVWQERTRLRHELHDSVTQVLSSISLLAQALPSAWRNSAEEGERRAQRLAELAQIAFAEMHALIRDLQPPQHSDTQISHQSHNFLGLERLRNGGLGAALPYLIEAMLPETLARQYCFGEYVPQHLSHEEALYRVCQEAVSNVIRHSFATQLAVEARVDMRHATLIVRDNGRGLPEDVAAGIGLESMRQRLLRIGGSLHLRHLDGGGLEVLAQLRRNDRQLEVPWPTSRSE